MSLIVAGRFDTFEAAQGACRALFLEGFAEDDVTVFFVNPCGQHDRFAVGGDRDVDPGTRHSHKGAGLLGGLFGAMGAAVGAVLGATIHLSFIVAVLAAAVGAYVGTLVGAMVATPKPRARNEPDATPAPRHAGVLVAVHAQEDSQATASRTLKQHGAQDIERALGRWRGGEWSDFDPLKAPVLQEKIYA